MSEVRILKIIVSHDVDHLYPSDHHFRDLYFPKLCVRSFLEWSKGKCTFREFFRRCGRMFSKRMHRIPEVISFDKEHGIPSTFFFGMANGLGMMYSKEKAAPMIQYVRDQGMDVGVHGIAYDDPAAICEEHDAFARLTGMDSFGIRMHYVRYTEDTFRFLSQAGYAFDSTQFDKNEAHATAPYLVDGMWEFPLLLMEDYMVLPGKLDDGKQRTLALLKKAEKENINFLVLLFHDVFFDSDIYKDFTAWYCWVIELFEKKKIEFISFRDAIRELEFGDAGQHY